MPGVYIGIGSHSSGRYRRRNAEREGMMLDAARLGRQELVGGALAVLIIIGAIAVIWRLARSKDQVSTFGFFLIYGGLCVALASSAVIGVVVFIGGVIVVAIRAPRPAPQEDDERGPCPYCAEDIKPEAILCPHCRSDLTRPTAADRLLSR
jgi:hypothetical protein